MLFYFCSFELGIIEAGPIRNTNQKIKNWFEDGGHSAWTTEIDSTDHNLRRQCILGVLTSASSLGPKIESLGLKT